MTLKIPRLAVSSWLLVLTIIVVGFIIAAAGVGIGYHLREIARHYRNLRSRVADLETDGGMPEPAIIEAKTPLQVKQDPIDDDDESAIIVAKKPDELRRERDRKFDEEMERYK